MTAADYSGPVPRAWASLTALPRAREVRPGEWRASCPTSAHPHGDRSAGLHVTLRPTGIVLLWCPLGCDARDILAACGLRLRDLYPDTPALRRARAVAARAIAGAPDPYRAAVCAVEKAAWDFVDREEARRIATAVVEELAAEGRARLPGRAELAEVLRAAAGRLTPCAEG